MNGGFEVLATGARVSSQTIAVAGFLAGYGGRTREAYGLRQFFAGCAERYLRLSHGSHAAEKAEPLAIT